MHTAVEFLFPEAFSKADPTTGAKIHKMTWQNTSVQVLDLKKTNNKKTAGKNIYSEEMSRA